MTAISTDNSDGRIWDVQIEELPLVSHGVGVTVAPTRLALVHGNVDSMFRTDTLDLNTYVNGTVNKIRGVLYQSSNGTSIPGSTTWSGTTLTFAGQSLGCGDGGGHVSSVYAFGALVEMQ